MVSLAAANITDSLNIFTLSLTASLLLLAMQCLTVQEAFAAINGRVILAIVVSFLLEYTAHDTPCK